MKWNKQIAFNNSNDIYIVFFFSLNTEQTVPARKRRLRYILSSKNGWLWPWNSSHFSPRGSVSYPPHSPSHISHEKWSPATFSLVTGVVLFVLNILLLLLLPSCSQNMLSIKMSANFHHALTKDSQVFETRWWNADYKVIRAPNIYCLLKISYWQIQ